MSSLTAHRRSWHVCPGQHLLARLARVASSPVKNSLVSTSPVVRCPIYADHWAICHCWTDLSDASPSSQTGFSRWEPTFDVGSVSIIMAPSSVDARANWAKTQERGFRAATEQPPPTATRRVQATARQNLDRWPRALPGPRRRRPPTLTARIRSLAGACLRGGARAGLQHAREPNVSIGHRGGVLKDVRVIFRLAIHAPERRKDFAVGGLKVSFRWNQLRPASCAFTRSAAK